MLSLRRRAAALLAGLFLVMSGGRVIRADSYAWRTTSAEGDVETRVKPPSGFERRPVRAGSFAAWLRGLPVRSGRPPVRLFNGKLKGNQEAHHLVLDVDVGTRDRQQCADAVIRLRAEYLRSAGRDGEVCFRFTNGTPARWSDWKAGMRPKLSARKTPWEKSAVPDGSYASFRRYLDTVFSYAGTFSLERELEQVAEPRAIEAGDVFIAGGFPGHAVIVVDVAEDPLGRRAVLLGQSYMPAQDIHILRNPASSASPWYIIEDYGPLSTPEWDFPAGALRRFSGACPEPRPSK